MNKLILNFADWILNLPLLEMASERNDKLIKIQSYSNTINEHLFKLYVMQKSIDRGHWIDEIDNFLTIINDITWSKKRYKFEEKDYFNWLFYYYFYDNKNNLKPNLKRKFENILSKYEKEIKINWTIEEFKNISETFFNYFCPKIENSIYNFEDFEKYIEERLKF